MSWKFRIGDGDGSGLEAHVHQFSTAARPDHAGVLVLTRTFQDFDPTSLVFLNDTFGAAMNQNVSFSGTPEIIHNGGSSTEWTGTAVAGTWNFADSGKVTITSADNNDQASFAEETPATIDMSGFTALTGKVDLDIYNATNNSIIVQFDNAGTDVGNSVNLNDFISTGDFAEQSFAIPKAEFGLTTQLLDGMTLTVTRIGGTKPTIKFDDIQFEQTGNPIVFKAAAPSNTRFHMAEIGISIADNVTGITTVTGATENATVPNLAYDALLGVSALTRGIVFARVKNEKTLFSVTLRQLGDFLAVGTTIIDHISDGTNSFIKLLILFPEPIVLKGGDEDFLSFTITDDLSSLLQFTAFARGSIEAQ